MPARRGLAAAGAAVALVSGAPPARAGRAVVLATDYETAYTNVLDLAPPYAHANAVGWACADAAVRVQAGRGWVLGRYGCDHVQVLDPANGFATIGQWSTGPGTNPQDVEIIGPGKAYVSLYERDFLAIVNPTTGQVLGTISLAAFSDADGLPEAAEMARAGNRVFVFLQRLDRPAGFRANNPSLVAVVDCTTDQLVDADPMLPGVQAIPLTGRNPFAEVQLDPVRQKIVVAEAGNFGVLDGGIEFIDPVGLRAEGWFVTEAALGGDLNAARLWVDCSGFAVVNDANYRTRLVRFDRCQGVALGTAWQSVGFDLCDLEIDAQDQVLVSDRGFTNRGVRIFRAADGTQVAGSPIDFGLPPCDIALEEPPTPADTSPAAAGLRLAPNTPDPFNPTTTLRAASAPGAIVALDILDVRGRRVRRLFRGALASGSGRWTWDGRDDAGAPVPSGVYVARLRDGRAVRTERLTLVR